MDYIALAVGLVIGILLGFLVARVRRQSDPAAGEAELRFRLAAAEESLRRTQGERDAASAERDALRGAQEGCRQELATVSERCAQFEGRLAESAGCLREVEIQNGDLREKSASSGAELVSLREQLARARAELDATVKRLAEAEAGRSGLAAHVAKLGQELDGTRSSYEERLKEIKDARDHLVTTFKATAAQLLQETKLQHAQEHGERLDAALKPFQEQLRGFQELVGKTYAEEGRERFSLKQEIVLLAERHQTLAKEAERLTSALVGSSKARGDWGEITLLRILERSGLREGHEFRVQESTTLADGTRLRPDVVISLPEDGALVIDSKLQLLAWARLGEAANPEAADAARAELIAAVRTHMRALDKKAYAGIYQRSVDMVVMYMPIDAALITVLADDPGIYDEAFARGVVLTGPTMLMALLGSLAHQWRGRHQEQNVLKIARMAEALGKKLESFLASYQQVGQRLRQGAAEYNKSLGLLSTGPGNILKKAADLGEMGIKSARKIGEDWEAISVDIEDPPVVTFAEAAEPDAGDGPKGS